MVRVMPSIRAILTAHSGELLPRVRPHSIGQIVRHLGVCHCHVTLALVFDDVCLLEDILALKVLRDGKGKVTTPQEPARKRQGRGRIDKTEMDLLNHKSHA